VEEFPKLKIDIYMSEDDESNLYDSDICITTFQSTGTGKDIFGLTKIYQTVSVLSEVINKQSIGRLRKVKDKQMEFYYFYSANITKHRRYHENRVKIFTSVCKKIKYDYYSDNKSYFDVT